MGKERVRGGCRGGKRYFWMWGGTSGGRGISKGCTRKGEEKGTGGTLINQFF